MEQSSITIIVKPKAGLKIRRPDTKAFLSEKGERVPNNTFWKRRLLDGDVEEVKETQTKKQDDVPAKAEPKTEKKGGK